MLQEIEKIGSFRARRDVYLGAEELRRELEREGGRRRQLARRAVRPVDWSEAVVPGEQLGLWWGMVYFIAYWTRGMGNDAMGGLEVLYNSHFDKAVQRLSPVKDLWEILDLCYPSRGWVGESVTNPWLGDMEVYRLRDGRVWRSKLYPVPGGTTYAEGQAVWVNLQSLQAALGLLRMQANQL